AALQLEAADGPHRRCRVANRPPRYPADAYDDRAGQHRIAGHGIAPVIPQAGKGENGRTVGGREQMRLLRAFLAGPLIKPARRDDAAPLFEGVAEIGLSLADSTRALK